MTDGFWQGARNYGLGNLFTDLDFVLSLVLLLVSVIGEYAAEWPVVNSKLISLSTQLSFSLIAFILTGLAVLASFSDAEFLKLLKELEIYDEIMFSFQFTLYLAMTVAIVGIVLQTYTTPKWTFFVFLFLFVYMLFSLTRFVRLIVELGEKQAEFEEAKSE
ncbi:MAG: hypothetical protein ABEH81_06440 [Halopenitus sp.]